MIDLHCHILPGMDDGARDIEESLAMARHAVEDGIEAVVATPHALGGSFANPPQKIIHAVAALRTRLAAHDIPLSVFSGSEIHICPQMASRILAGEAVFLCENKRYVLIEFPFQTIPMGFQEELYQLILHGITPVIAHPERNPTIHPNPAILYELAASGCLIQVNSTSVHGGFGDDIMLFSHELIRNRLAHAIASDAHSADSRPPALSAALDIAAKVLKNRQAALRMVQDTPAAIASGRPVDVCDPVQTGRGMR